MGDLKFNQSHNKDLTAYNAINNIDKQNVDEKNNLFVKIVRGIARNLGFEILGRIHIRHIESGREYW